MNKIAKKTALWGRWFVIFASLILCVGMGASQALAVSVDTTNNNFTMIDSLGGLTGGTNDVHFTWDGTLKTSVAASGQVSNATILSDGPCLFFGVSWSAHDVAIYGPGTYTVYSGCPSGSPGCKTGTPITFTVGAAELGVHMLFDYGPSLNIDVVDVWTPNAVFAPSPMWIGACGSNSASTVWDWMSTDWNNDGKNGADMVDGPFPHFNANFNVKGNPCGGDPLGGNCNDANPCTDDSCAITDNTHGTCVHTAPRPGCDTQCVGLADGTACDDHSVCTTGDHCVNGACTGTAVNCDDNNLCTTDSCDAVTGCVHTNNTVPCDDHNPNTFGDACSNGVCVGNQACSPAPTLVSPADGQTGVGTTMEFRWTKCVDPDNDTLKYHLTYCITPGAEGCPSVVDVADAGRKNSKSVFYASGAGLLMIGMTFIGGLKGRKKIIALLIIVTLFTGGAFISCKNTKNADQTTPLGANEMNFMVSGLTPSTTYYWKVDADDGRTGGLVGTGLSRSFTTQQ